jgi:hypothetical protein
MSVIPQTGHWTIIPDHATLHLGQDFNAMSGTPEPDRQSAFLLTLSLHAPLLDLKHFRYPRSGQVGKSSVPLNASTVADL